MIGEDDAQFIIELIDSIHGFPKSTRYNTRNMSEIKEKTKYDFTVYRYYARSLAISCYNDDASTSRKNKVLVVRIKSKEAAQNLKAKSKDSKLDLWGLKIDEIKKQLGEPGRVSSGNFTYEYKNATGRGNVNFICYDFWQNQCKELSIQWFY